MPKPKYSRALEEAKMKMGLDKEMTDKPKVYPSTLQLDEGDLPEIKEWQVGQKYEITLLVKCVGMSSTGEYAPPDDSDKDKVHARFEVLEAESEEND